MRDNSGCKRAYIRCSKAWYHRQDYGISVMIGMYHTEGGTTGEFEIEWVPLSGKLCARLKSFEDSWSALQLFQDLLAKMAEVDSENIQEPDFCKILDELGILDITEYERGKPANTL